MTTNADPIPAPVDEPSLSEYAQLWRAIGRLEGTAAALLEGQRELKEGQQELRAEFQAGQQELRAEFQAGQQELKEGQQELKQELRAEFQAGQQELKEGQQELKQELRAEFQAGQQESRAEFQAGQREANRRIDRLFYLFLGIGGALLVSVYATQFIGS